MAGDKDKPKDPPSSSIHYHLEGATVYGGIAGRDYTGAVEHHSDARQGESVEKGQREYLTKPRQEANPFVCGPPVAPEGFYGRQRERSDIRNRIGARSPQSINLVGLWRSGKTSLLRLVREKPEEFFRAQQKPLVVYLDLQNSCFHTPEGLREGLRRGIKQQIGDEPWKREESDDPFAVEDGLQDVKERGWRLVVQLDEFECIGARLAAFREWGQDWRAKASAELLTLMVASRRPMHEIYKTLELASPFDNIFSTTVLGALEPEAWRQLVRDGLPEVLAADLEMIDALAGGLPYYVQMAASCLWQTGDEAAMHREFEFQVRGCWQRLWGSLSVPEQNIAKKAAAYKDLPMDSRVVTDLRRYGILREDGRLFSGVFCLWQEG